MSEEMVADAPARRSSQIFEELGFYAETDEEAYVNRMENTFGRDGRKFMDALDQAIADGTFQNPEVMRKIYKQKNKDWRMSLYVSLHEDLSKHHALLEWIESREISAFEAAVDIGCDIGVFSCALARLFPKSQIHGFDRVKESIQNAQRLARSKNITNVNFLTFELGNRSHLPEVQYQLGIAPFVLQELFRNTLSGVAPGNEELTAAEQLSGLMEENGLLISVDRLPGGHNEAKPMVDIVASQGFECIEQDTLVVPGQIMIESFPISIFKKCR